MTANDKIFDIVVDAQHDFMVRDGKLYVSGAEAIIPFVQKHVADVRSVGILFTFDTHYAETYPASEEAKQFPIHCVKDTDGWQLVVNPRTAHVPCYTMEKGVFDMWAESGLTIDRFPPAGLIIDRDNFFDDLKAIGVTKIRIVGVAADYCVKWAVDGAVARGFEVEIVRDLTVGIQRDIDQVVANEFADKAVSCS